MLSIFRNCCMHIRHNFSQQWQMYFQIYQENAKFGTCDTPPISPPPPAAATAEPTSQSTSTGSSLTTFVQFRCLLWTILSVTVFYFILWTTRHQWEILFCWFVPWPVATEVKGLAQDVQRLCVLFFHVWLSSNPFFIHLISQPDCARLLAQPEYFKEIFSCANWKR